MRFIWIRTGFLVLVLALSGVGITDARSQDTSPVPIKREHPRYPFELRRAGISGTAIVEFVVTTKGKVADAFVIRSTHPDFGPAAVAAIMKWRFKPGKVGGRNVNTRLQIPITFALSKDGKAPIIYTGIFRPLGEDSLEKLSKEMRYEVPPHGEKIAAGVYPYNSLLENERAVVMGGALISSQGTVDSVLWKSQNIGDHFKQATLAMLDTAELEPATKKKTPISTMIWFRVEFDPYRGDVRIPNTAAEILKRLRIEGEGAPFTKSTDLDNKITILEQIAPIFPRLQSDVATSGQALIEFYIDKYGHAQLTRVISASEPAYGYAACQAIAQWQFEPPLKDGKPVVVKVRVPVVFKRR
jgi:TonB family protein